MANHGGAIVFQTGTSLNRKRYCKHLLGQDKSFVIIKWRDQLRPRSSVLVELFVQC